MICKAVIAKLGDLVGTAGSCARASTCMMLLGQAAHASTLTTLYSFGGRQTSGPQDSLTQAGGSLYGEAQSLNNSPCKAYKFRVETGYESTMADVSCDSTEIALTALGGALYGVDYDGGVNGQGRIIKIDIQTRALSTAYSFDLYNGHPQTELVALNGVLYGASAEQGYGEIFSFNPSTGVLTNLHTQTETERFAGSLVASGTILYGTAGNAIFSFDPETRQEAVLFEFPGGKKLGSGPHSLVQHGNHLYGVSDVYDKQANTTTDVLFNFSIVTGVAKHLYTFPSDPPGCCVNPHLVVMGHFIYGTTGLIGDSGTIFGLDLKNDSFTTLYTFPSETGGPLAGLTKYRGSLYGTTYRGGSKAKGTLFRFVP